MNKEDVLKKLEDAGFTVKDKKVVNKEIGYSGIVGARRKPLVFKNMGR